ncbi:MAG TPA: PAS domain-containing sensor histidine kinase [Burkholderiales bacterium]|nr:PAS domain-containing sensor histidine kinase [Burkholderiales bacterium]
MTPLLKHKPLVGRSRRSRGRMLIVFGPVLALGVLIVLLAVVAGWYGWHPREMHFIAVSLGAAAMLLALALLYAQTKIQKSAERALHNAQARVGDIIESAMDAIVTVDESQRIVLFNAAAEKVFRWPRDAVLGQPLEMLIPERLRRAHREHIERFGATGVTSRRMGLSTVLVALRANNEEFPIEASISQHSEDQGKFFTVILRDVTERSRVEEMLSRDETRLRGILDSAMDAIITVDENEHIVLFNPAAEAAFGCPRDEALGAPLAWFIPERFRASHSGHIKRFGEGGVASRRMATQRIVTGLRRNGGEFPIEASISWHSEHGRKFFTVILRDVTERVRADEALRRSKDELRELAAIASSVREQEKNRVARELHDELAQALTALKMDLAWIKDSLPAGQQQLWPKLEAMQAMLDSTVKATRRIAADLRPLMLDDLGLIPAAEWLVQNFVERSGIQCEFEFDPPELELQDPHATAVFRILQESLANVARHAQASLVSVTINVRGGEVMLRVRDNGRGFEPGSPRKPNSFGLVGLRERAHLLDGEISVDTAPGKGTLIDVRIPLQSMAPAP